MALTLKELIAMTAPRAVPVPAGLQPAAVCSIHAGHDHSSGLPVVTVTQSLGQPRVFEFTDVVARDRFLLLLVDACELAHSVAA
jgi:hypothetical protein